MISEIIVNSYSLRCVYALRPSCCCFVNELLGTSFERVSLRVRASGKSMILYHFMLISMLLPSIYSSASFSF